MPRILIRVLFLALALAAVIPFLATSLQLDSKGTLVRGHVVNKDEWITVRYSSYTRHSQVKIGYEPPDGSAVPPLIADVAPEQFDQMHKGDVAELRYLLSKDLPNWPGLRTFRQMHLLPFARLATQDTWSGLRDAIAGARGTVAALVLGGILLIAWRVLRLPFFSGIVLFCILTAIVLGAVSEFPKPTPPPVNNVRVTTGTVKSVERWRELFETKNVNDPIRWMAAQPVAVLGVQFIPEGRTDPVVAVDLIDDGSLSGLAEHAQVSVEYEAAAPRVSHVRGAQRQFAKKNMGGLVQQALALALVTLVLWGGALLFGQFVKKLTTTRRPTI